MSFIRYAVIALSLLSLAAIAQAASFDCKNASIKVEKLMCSNQRLSNSSEELMSVYTEAMKKVGDPETLRNEQCE